MDLDAVIARIDPPEVARLLFWLAVILVLTAVALRVIPQLVGGLVDRALTRPAANDTQGELSVLEFEKRRRTLRALTGNGIRVIVVVVAVVAVLGVFDIDLGPAIAGLGLAGLAIGLGLQGLVKDVVAGAFILIENQYAKGDIVTIAGATGSVEELGLRRTRLRDFDGTVHVVPNGLIGVASNLTRVWARVVVDVPVADPARIEDASRLIDDIGRQMAADPAWRGRLLAPPKVDRVKTLSSTGVTLKVVGMAAAGDRWSAAGEVRRRVAEAFAAADIDLGGP